MFAVVGFIVAVLLGGWLAYGAAMGAYVSYAFSGRIQKGDVVYLSIMFAIGVLILYYSFTHAPFSISFSPRP